MEEICICCQDDKESENLFIANDLNKKICLKCFRNILDMQNFLIKYNCDQEAIGQCIYENFGVRMSVSVGRKIHKKLKRKNTLKQINNIAISKEKIDGQETKINLGNEQKSTNIEIEENKVEKNLDKVKPRFDLMPRSLGSGIGLSNRIPFNYLQATDEDIAKIAKDGDEEATEFLVNKYKDLVRFKSKSYFLAGADREDIVQEGLIGLYKSIRDFRADKLSSFGAFANLCITRQIISAVKMATRQKHIPMNNYISLDKPIYDVDSERTMKDIISSGKQFDPEEQLLKMEFSQELRDDIFCTLSDLEAHVLEKYLEGKSYDEMATDLRKHVKTIDNALQRIKRKIEKNVKSY